MQRSQFDTLLAVQIRAIESTLGNKRTEYARDEDVLENFRSAAHMQNATLREALGGMMAKHTASLYKLISEWDCAPMEVWSEKITDHINYLILLRAIVTEELRVTDAKTQPVFEETPLYKSGVETAHSA